MASGVASSTSGQRVTVSVYLRDRASPPDPGAVFSREAYAAAHRRERRGPRDVAAGRRGERAARRGGINAARPIRRAERHARGARACLRERDRPLRGRGRDAPPGRTGALRLPAELTGIVTEGLRPRRPRPGRRQSRPGSAAAVAYEPPQVAAAYDFPPAATEPGECDRARSSSAAATRSRPRRLLRRARLAAAERRRAVAVDGGANAPGDRERRRRRGHARHRGRRRASPPAPTIVVYFAPNTDQGFLDAITTAVHDTTQHAHRSSRSAGAARSPAGPQQALTPMDQAFADAAALGVTVTVAAGDNGSTDGVDRRHRSTSTSPPPARTRSPAAAPACTPQRHRDQLARPSGTTAASGGATGGGVSDVFPLPTWQAGAGVPARRRTGGRPGAASPTSPATPTPRPATTSASTAQTHADRRHQRRRAALGGSHRARSTQRLGRAVGFAPARPLRAPRRARRSTTSPSGNNGAYRAPGPAGTRAPASAAPTARRLLALLGRAAPTPPLTGDAT